jgi:DNA polymerase-3 subunit gamma/tau
MAGRLPMRALSRIWQMLLKALEEVALAPNAMMAAEMAVIRLTHVADLPTPDDLIRKLQSATPPAPTGGGIRPAQQSGTTTSHAAAPPVSGGAQPVTDLAIDALARFARFDDVVDLIRAHRDGKLLYDVERTLRLARYQPGRIEVELTDDAAPDIAQRLGSRLQAWTGNRWAVSVVSDGGGKTLYEVENAQRMAEHDAARTHPLVQAVLTTFPKSKIVAIRSAAALTHKAEAEALPEVDEEWDPFDDA